MVGTEFFLENKNINGLMPYDICSELKLESMIAFNVPCLQKPILIYVVS
jgi:hypothetical protein